ncbi:MAG: menaquinone-dependent protoporphyrinogen IX dehydrogenase [Gammaproteobacteria bacterium HGW-Gammaproteobacteria-8]|nr:MAG: menaquinone-dependent protoporphyrinogen IX dehydrogenase [Gammaproteobacteria bacterium HGW-Gammaproteobacteria-8]
MARTLIVYWSGYGHTRRIVERLRDRLSERGDEVVTAAIDADEIDLSVHDRIVIGASIRNGKHKPVVHAFIQQHLELLNARPSAFFSVNLVARKPHKNTPETNPYMKAFVEKSPWRPDLLGVFAGNLDYRRYSFSDRSIIRFIMWLTKGPTAADTRIEYTDWDAVDRFAAQIAELGRPPSADAAG